MAGDFYRVTPSAHDHLYIDSNDDTSADTSTSAVRYADYSKTARASAFESSNFSEYGITNQSGAAIAGRDIRDTDLITVDGIRMQIGSARQLGLISPDRK